MVDSRSSKDCVSRPCGRGMDELRGPLISKPGLLGVELLYRLESIEIVVMSSLPDNYLEAWCATRDKVELQSSNNPKTVVQVLQGHLHSFQSLIDYTLYAIATQVILNG